MRHIRIISPSGCIDAMIVAAARQTLEDWGYQVTLGQHVTESFGRFAGSCEHRIADFREAWLDDTVDYILCSRGGYGLQQIIDSLADIVLHDTRDKQPVIIGFSDITELHSLCALRGLVSIHGGMARQLAENTSNPAVEALKGLLQGEAMNHHLPAHPLNRHGMAEGRLVGGNLSVLYGLQGTPMGLNAVIGNDKPILFLEDIGEQHYHIDRMMHNLRLSGVLNHISGLVIGRFTDCKDDATMQCTLMETIRQVVNDQAYPVAFAFPAGHEEPNYPLRLGKKHTLSVSDEGVLLTEN